MSVIGLDLGTSGIRAMAFGIDRRALASSARRLTLLRDGRGRVELDPVELISAAEDMLREAAAAAEREGDPVRAVGLSVLGEAVVPVDVAGAPLARIAVSMDTRGAGPAEALGRVVGARRFARVTGQPLHGMFSVFKVMAGEEGWRSAAGFRCVGDLLAQRWTGVAGIDLGQAARFGLLDVDAGRWSEELLAAAASIAPWVRAERLSAVHAAGEVIGRITGAAADATGLAEGTPLVAGTHDQAAAFLGAGGAAGVRSVIAFGSSDCLTVGTAARPDGLEGTGFASYRVHDGLWVTLAGTAAGGWALEWLAGLLDRDVADVFGHMAGEPPALLFLPYLAGSGTLDNDPRARGAVHGLTLETTAAELARAVVEGAGYEFRKIIDAFADRGIPVGEIRVSGAGAENRAALHARADAAGVPLVPVPSDASARGAAMLALRALGEDPDGLRPDPISEPASPDAALSDWYARQQRAYADLYDLTRPIAAHLSSSSATHQKENMS
ncbi:FGGY-family carbohydrate kinase [Microbacterium tumbae]